MDLKTPKMPPLDYLKKYSNNEKGFLIYAFLLVILLVTLPLFQTGSLSSSETISYGFFNMGMIKTNILSLVLLIVMIGWNLSASIRQSVSQILGFRSHDAFVNIMCLCMLILLMFGIGDTVGVIHNNFSQRVSTTSSYYILLIYLLVGLIVAGYIAYASSKNVVFQEEKVEVPHEDEIRQSDAFKKVEEEFSGLFNEEGENTAPPEETVSENEATRTSDYLR